MKGESTLSQYGLYFRRDKRARAHALSFEISNPFLSESPGLVSFSISLLQLPRFDVCSLLFGFDLPDFYGGQSDADELEDDEDGEDSSECAAIIPHHAGNALVAADVHPRVLARRLEQTPLVLRRELLKVFADVHLAAGRRISELEADLHQFIDLPSAVRPDHEVGSVVHAATLQHHVQRVESEAVSIAVFSGRIGSDVFFVECLRHPASHLLSVITRVFAEGANWDELAEEEDDCHHDVDDEAARLSRALAHDPEERDAEERRSDAEHALEGCFQEGDHVGLVPLDLEVFRRLTANPN